MMLLTARLKDGYCSINVAKYGLITIIRFVSKSYSHPSKSFANKLRLVLHVLKILFSENVCCSCDTQPNRAAVCSSAEKKHRTTPSRTAARSRLARLSAPFPSLDDSTFPHGAQDPGSRTDCSCCLVRGLYRRRPRTPRYSSIPCPPPI